MAVDDNDILAQNPWWLDPTSIQRDPYLKDRADSPVDWTPPVLEAVAVGPRRVHTLRGPRQVGKTTTMKGLIQTLLDRGERRVLYFSFDLSTDPRDIVDVVRRARQLHSKPDGSWYLFLDEVTSIRNWQLGVKHVVDQGPAREDFILCTGSSARDLGSERLPGRRGVGRDYVQLPMSFRDFATSVASIPLPGDRLQPEDAIDDPEGSALLREIHLSREPLERAWRAYEQVGGFPAAIRDYMEHGTVRDASIMLLWAIISSDVQRAGRSDVATLKLLERVVRSLGSTLSWTTLADEMDVSHPTAKEYVELLSESFVLLTVFFWDRSTGSFNPRKQRKVFFTDPLFEAVPRVLRAGRVSADTASRREAIVGASLFRSTVQRLVQATASVGTIGFTKSRSGTEIDFLVPTERWAGDGGMLPVEVKGDSLRAIGYARSSMRQSFGRGLIITDTRLDLEDEIPAIPAPVFCASLGEQVERVPLDG